MKQETEKAKNFFSGILKAPAQTMKTVANDSSNTFLKTGIVVLVAWVLLSGVNEVIGILRTIIKYGFKYLEDRLDIYNEMDRVYYYDLLDKYYKMLENYYDSNGLLKQYPSKKPLRDIILKRIGEQFEYNKDYKEKEVNEIIRKNIIFNDVEMIRRELYNNHILNRLKDGSKYWKED